MLAALIERSGFLWRESMLPLTVGRHVSLHECRQTCKGDKKLSMGRHRDKISQTSVHTDARPPTARLYGSYDTFRTACLLGTRPERGCSEKNRSPLRRNMHIGGAFNIEPHTNPTITHQQYRMFRTKCTLRKRLAQATLTPTSSSPPLSPPPVDIDNTAYLASQGSRCS